jgi:ABC-type branched-subunit amino acid transport system substrate-binding protein
MRETSKSFLVTAKRASVFASVMTSMLVLAGCSGIEGIPGLSGGTATPAAGVAVSGQTIGTGPVKIALLLPFSNANGAAPAQALRNAAELAISEFNGQELTILVKDDKGTAEGAAAAAQQALSEGAELILGPLFSPAVSGAGPVAKAAGRPMIGFSSDASAAQPGVYLLSFLPQADVNRVVSYAGSKGKKKFAILAPQDAYGEATVGQFQAAVSAVSGGSVVGVQRYAPGGLAEAAASFASTIASADALLIPEDGGNVAAAAGALASAGAGGGKVQLLGTGRWNSPAVFGAAALSGAWFPAPDGAGFAGFSRRYQAKFSAAPARIATLAYDAVALANVLTRTQGDTRFSSGILQTASGFGGQDGVFRFRADGTNDRALAVFQVGNGSSSIVSPAPKSFAKSGT